MNERELVILKARQLGISWLVVSYCLWKTLFHENVKILFLSQGQKEAIDLVGGGDSGSPGKAKFIYNHLPDFLRPRLGRDTQEMLDIPATGGVMEALPSTEKAGRSTDATIVVRDELERHPYASTNFTAIGPTVDAGGQLIDLSTVDKMVSNTHFKERYIKAKSGENNARAIFLPWNMRPVREQGMALDEWFEGIKRKYRDWEVEQEYPGTEEEALSTLTSRQFFDIEATDSMLLDVMNPIDTDINTRNGMIKVFKPPVVGRKYCIFTDPSDGKEDPHYTVVMDWATGEGVCISHGKIPADEVAKVHDELVRFYNNAFNSYELNAYAGGKFDESIKALETPGRAYFRKPDGKPDYTKYGWWTGPQTKKAMLWGLEEAVRKRLVIIHDRETINEFKGFIMPEGKEPQATQGMHDDAIMAWGGVWQIRKYMPSGEFVIRSMKYKD